MHLCYEPADACLQQASQPPGGESRDDPYRPASWDTSLPSAPVS